MTRKLTLDDIADLRAYEQERPAYLTRVIELKGRRRVTVGPFVTFVFENRETMRFQIQEMAQAQAFERDYAVHLPPLFLAHVIVGPQPLLPNA